MFRWAWRVGTTFSAATAIIVIKLMVHDTEIIAIWSPVNLGIMFGGLLGSLYGIRAQFTPAHAFDFRRDVILNVGIGVVGGALVGSLVAVSTSTRFPDLSPPLFDNLGPIVMVWTVVGTVIGLVVGAIIDWLRPAPPAG